MLGLVWFREDLRVFDHTALYQAASKCQGGIVGLYIIDAHMFKEHQVAACRVDLILRGLHELSRDLAELNIPLIIIQVSDTQKIPAEIVKLMQKIHVDVLFYNRQYEVNEQRRDQAVCDYLTTNNLSSVSFDDQTILPPGIITTQKGQYFSIFTPFKRAWYQEFLAQRAVQLLPKPKKQVILSIKSSPVPESLTGFKSHISSDLWPAGEKYARARLQKFIASDLQHYAKNRDFPALAATSRLSPYIASGMISARECFLSAFDANHQELDTGKMGAVTWMAELIWRDFYKHILQAVPRISMHRAFKQETDQLAWRDVDAERIAWEEGRTGYPLVDAAMRQLNATGWMHNRLRMVVAMFFSKNLFLNWRLGERYFMQHLIDGDLAANNGGWQWSASTGNDAAPYFRVFNPIRQSERFDPKGDFIRQYCPELAGFDSKSIHDPHGRAPLLAKQAGYAKPMVDLASSRERVISAFKMIK